MFGSGWGKLSKAGFGLAVLIAILVGYSLWGEASFYDDMHQIEAQERARDYADAARIDTEAECTIPGLSLEECNQEAQRSARPDQRDEYDLASQRTMAAWTSAMGKAAIIGMGVGILGLGLIFVTFRETRTANELLKMSLRPRVFARVHVWVSHQGEGKAAGQTEVQLGVLPNEIEKGAYDLLVRSCEVHLHALPRASKKLTRRDPPELLNPTVGNPHSRAYFIWPADEFARDDVGALDGTDVSVTIAYSWRDTFGELIEARERFKGTFQNNNPAPVLLMMANCERTG